MLSANSSLYVFFSVDCLCRVVFLIGDVWLSLVVSHFIHWRQHFCELSGSTMMFENFYVLIAVVGYCVVCGGDWSPITLSTLRR